MTNGQDLRIDGPWQGWKERGHFLQGSQGTKSSKTIYRLWVYNRESQDLNHVTVFYQIIKIFKKSTNPKLPCNFQIDQSMRIRLNKWGWKFPLKEREVNCTKKIVTLGWGIRQPTGLEEGGTFFFSNGQASDLGERLAPHRHRLRAGGTIQPLL